MSHDAATNSNGHAPLVLDAGSDAETRARLCVTRTWCVLELGHDGPCVEVPRTKQEPTDFGPHRNRGKR